MRRLYKAPLAFISAIIVLSTFTMCQSPPAPSKETKNTLKIMSDYYSNRPSDINEHLPVLKELAEKSPRVTEIGIRSMVSTWSVLYGLAQNKASNRSYTGIDLNHPPLESLVLSQTLAEVENIKYQFIKGNDMNIDLEETDLLFIDSLHTYVHLTYELEKFAPNVSKFIALHDTSAPWGELDDSEYHGDFSEYPKEYDRNKRGLWVAVTDFLDRHPEWALKERRTNNHGFTVLERK